MGCAVHRFFQHEQQIDSRAGCRIVDVLDDVGSANRQSL